MKLRVFAMAAVFAVAAAACGGQDKSDPAPAGGPGGSSSPVVTVSPQAPQDGGNGTDDGTGAGALPPPPPEPVPTSAPPAAATPTSPPQAPVEVTPDPAPDPAPVECGTVLAHGEPHAIAAVDTDGDGIGDACERVDDHAHGPVVVEPEPPAPAVAVPSRIDRPDEGCVELESGEWDCEDEETTLPGLATPEPTVEVWGGGGNGWRYDGHGQPVAERVWSQAETASPWPPAGEGEFELDWMTQCMRERHENVSEAVRRGWLTESKLSYDEGARVCSVLLSDAWGPVVLEQRDRACVYGALLNRYIRSISGVNRQHTMWDCPTGPDGTDPDPLRPFEVRCGELNDRMQAAGHDRVVCVTESVPARDPADPCDSQRFAAQWLFWVWLRSQGLENTTRYDWRPC